MAPLGTAVGESCQGEMKGGENVLVCAFCLPQICSLPCIDGHFFWCVVNQRKAASKIGKRSRKMARADKRSVIGLVLGGCKLRIEWILETRLT